MIPNLLGAKSRRHGRSSSVKQVKANRVLPPTLQVPPPFLQFLHPPSPSHASNKSNRDMTSTVAAFAFNPSTKTYPSQHLLQQSLYDSLHPSEIPAATQLGERVQRESTLRQIMDLMAREHRLVATILLHTYRTFTTMQKLLDTLNCILEDILSSGSENIATKKQCISNVQYFLCKWLSPPHVADFNDPPHFRDLLCVVNLVHSWRQWQSRAFNTVDTDKSWTLLTSRIEAALNGFSPENHEYAERAVDVDTEDRLDDGDIPLMRSSASQSHIVKSTSAAFTYNLLVPHQQMEQSDCKTTRPTSSLLKVQQFDAKLIAQQLTFIDKEVYSRFVVHHCLQQARDKQRQRLPSPNLIDTFNRLSRVVDFTVRCAARSGSGETALYKWILVTKELRALKNYNCLMAVSQAVQKFRTEDAYADLFKAILKQHNKAQQLIKEIDRLNDLSGNYEYVRSLQAEHTALAMTESPSSFSHASVPFLCPYLYQLILTANASATSTDELIQVHFLRRVHEFTILCSICCPQRCAKFYQHLVPNTDFLTWYHNLPALVDDPQPALSQSLAPPRINSSTSASVSATSSSQGSPKDQHNYRIRPLSTAPVHRSNTTCAAVTCSSQLSRPASSILSSSPSHSEEPMPVIVRVRLVDSQFMAAHGHVAYKSVLVSPNDMMPSVIRNCLRKFDREEADYGLYQLVQIITSPHKEIMLPDLQNAYYALAKDSSEGIYCELRQKPMQPKSVQSVKHREHHRPMATRLRHSSSMSGQSQLAFVDLNNQDLL